MVFVSVARRVSGQYSLIIVTALGIAAPRPTPVMNRQITNCVRSPENADVRQAAPKTNTEPTRTSLRPNLSPRGPANSAPADSPNSAAVKTGPSADRSRPHWLTNAGAI